MRYVLGDRAQLLSLYSIAQELIPFGVDPWECWRRRLGYLKREISREFDPSRRYQLENFPSNISPGRPVIFVTMHIDHRFADGMIETTRLLAGSRSGASFAAIAGGQSSDSVYRPYYLHNDNAALMKEFPLSVIGVEDRGFSRKVVRHLQESGVLFVTIDASAGRSKEVVVEFLTGGMRVKLGLFQAAQKFDADIVPMVLNSDTNTIYYGNSLRGSTHSPLGLAQYATNFLSHHVLLAPEKWLHWSEFYKLSPQKGRNPDLDGLGKRGPDWFISEGVGGATALELSTWRLFEFNDVSYNDVIASGEQESYS